MAITRTQAKELIDLIQENEIARFFEKIGDYHSPTPEISQLKREFISGRYGFDFYDRLQIYVNSLAATNFEIVAPKYDVFFSFSSKNKLKAEEAVVLLRKSGLSVFFSDESLKNEIGATFFDKINEALKDSQHFILYCTPEAMLSAWVQLEYQTFFSKSFLPSGQKRRFFILEGENFAQRLLPDLLHSIQTTQQVEDIIKKLGREIPKDDLSERIARYKELFEGYFEDGIITEAERKALEFTKRSLQLSNEIVAGIENAVVWEYDKKKAEAEIAKQQAWLNAERERLEREARDLAEKNRVAEEEKERQEKAKKEQIEREAREKAQKEEEERDRQKREQERLDQTAKEKREKEEKEKLEKDLAERTRTTATWIMAIKDFRKPLIAASVILLLLLIIIPNAEKMGQWFTANTQDTTSTSTEQAKNQLPTTTNRPPTINQDSIDQAELEKRKTDSLAQVKEETAYKALKNTEAAYTAFLQKYPNSTYKADVQARLDKLTDLPPFAEPKMVYVQGDTYEMGYKEGRDGDNDSYMSSATLHEVTVSSFQMGAYEVSNQEFVVFLNEKGNQKEGGETWIDLAGSYENEKCRIIKSGSAFKVQQGYENYPVIYVSWFGARAYCNWLAGKTSKKYRLPTEAEWEYAARQKGQSVMFGNGKDIADPSQMNFDASASYKKSYSVVGTYRGKTVPVNSFSPNSLGLYNMSGNVWEWCEDWYASDFYEKTRGAKNPVNKNTGTDRVNRGGSWLSYPGNCRVANRNSFAPTDRLNFLGFRLVISL